MVLPSPRTSSAARGGPHGPMRAQKRMPYSSVGRSDDVVHLAVAAGGVDEQVDEVAGAGRLGVGRARAAR